MSKPILYCDMDGVLCDFVKSAKKQKELNSSQPYPQSKWGFFLDLEEIPNAISSIRMLEEKYEVWILTRPSFNNVHSFSEKAYWIEKMFGFEMLEKTIMCGNKALLKGAVLVDDYDNAGQPDFEGEWIKFGTDEYTDWNSVVKYLLGEDRFNELDMDLDLNV